MKQEWSCHGSLLRPGKLLKKCGAIIAPLFSCNEKERKQQKKVGFAAGQKRRGPFQSLYVL